MPEFVLPIGGALLVVAVAWFVPRWLDQRTKALKLAMDYMERSQDAARRLLKAEGVQDVLIPPVLFFACNAGQPRLARQFLYDVSSGRVAKLRSSPSERSLEVREAIRRLPDEHMQLLGECVNSALLSSAASDPLLGAVSLRYLQFGLQPSTDTPQTSEPIQTQFITMDLVPRMDQHRSLAPA